MPALLMGSASCLRGNVPPVPIRLVAYAMGPSCPGAAMSEEWPNGWYRDEQGRQAQPGFTPRQDAQGSPYEPTQAVPPRGPRGRTSRRRAPGPLPGPMKDPKAGLNLKKGCQTLDGDQAL